MAKLKLLESCALWWLTTYINWIEFWEQKQNERYKNNQIYIVNALRLNETEWEITIKHAMQYKSCVNKFAIVSKSTRETENLAKLTWTEIKSKICINIKYVFVCCDCLLFGRSAWG